MGGDGLQAHTCHACFLLVIQEQRTEQNRTEKKNYTHAVKTTPHINYGKKATLVSGTVKLLYQIKVRKLVYSSVVVALVTHTVTHFRQGCRKNTGPTPPFQTLLNSNA